MHIKVVLKSKIGSDGKHNGHYAKHFLVLDNGYCYEIQPKTYYISPKADKARQDELKAYNEANRSRFGIAMMTIAQEIVDERQKDNTDD